MRQRMTVRRGSDGAEKGKLRKKSALFQFLKPKHKDKGQESDPKSGSLDSRRSLSASDLHKIGAVQDDGVQNLLLKYQTSTPTSDSPSESKSTSTLAKAARRISWFRDRKNDLARSLENIHSIESEPIPGTLPRKISRLHVTDDRSITRSAQNLHDMGRVSTMVNQSHNSRLSNIKTLGKLQSQSVSDIPSGNEVIRRNMMQNAKSAVANVDEAALLKKTKWRNSDNDSPGVSSEESGSIGSTNSNYSLDSLPPHGETSGTCENIVDEGYMRMNYDSDETKLCGGASQPDKKSNYMLITPDKLASDDVEDNSDVYMKMDDVQSCDVDSVDQGGIREFRTVPGPEVAVDANEARSSHENKSPGAQDDNVTTRRRSPPQLPYAARCSWSSNEGSVFSSSASEIPSPLKNRPLPLPPTAKQELRHPYTSSNDIIVSAGDENPIPLPPKTYRQFSNQSSVSDEEKSGRLSPTARPKVDYCVVTSHDSEGPLLPPPRHKHKRRVSHQSDEEKVTSVTAEKFIDRPFVASSESAVTELEEVPVIGRQLPPIPKGDSSPSASRRDTNMLMQMYATVNRDKKNLAQQNSVPLQYKREISQQSTKSDGDVSPMTIRRLLSPKVSEAARELRSFSEMSLSEYEDISPIGTTEKKPKALWKDLSKRVTMNFRQTKRTKSPPKARANGSMSHFYVDACPVTKDDYAAEDKAEVARNEYGNHMHTFQREKLRRPLDLPVRPDFLDLANTQPARYETVDFDSGNICLSADDYAIDDDNIDHGSVRQFPKAGRNLRGTKLQQKSNDSSTYTRHIQQKRTDQALNNEKVYTEVTLKEKDSSVMPRKGFMSLAKDKKVKGKSASDADEAFGQVPGYDSDENTDVFQRKPSQKILSSPTKDGKGYESISLRDEVITTPLDEIEGRPYMNLGFHKKKGKTGVDKRRSADDAAIKMLMTLQNEKKIGDEISARRIGNEDMMPRKGNYDIDTDQNDEVSYVNIGKNRKLSDNSGSDVTKGNGRNRRPSAEDESTYQNIGISSNAMKVQGSHKPLNATTQNAPRTRENPSFKQEPGEEHLYSNIGFGERNNNKPETKRERPRPAPRPKKPERRKINQVPTKEARKYSDGNQGGNAYNEIEFSPPRGYIKNGSPQTNVLDKFGISESSYINVGSSGYHDDFDVGRVNEPHTTVPKEQNYVNVQEEFQPRRQRKKSAEWDLAYVDVMVIKGREQTVDAWPCKDASPPDCSDKSSPKANMKDPLRSRCAYTEIDFMKSQGISEAVRERRVESFEDTIAD